jgi:chromosome segregation ATPase
MSTNKKIYSIYKKLYLHSKLQQKLNDIDAHHQSVLRGGSGVADRLTKLKEQTQKNHDIINSLIEKMNDLTRERETAIQERESARAQKSTMESEKNDLNAELEKIERELNELNGNFFTNTLDSIIDFGDDTLTNIFQQLKLV